VDANFLTDLATRTRELREQGLYKNERILVSPQNAAIRVEGETVSAITSTSEAPATMSIPTTPKTRRFAAATNALPGPQILSTAGTLAVPYASAAIACAPPIVKTRVTPARHAAASTRGLRTPPGVGTTMTISRTP